MARHSDAPAPTRERARRRRRATLLRPALALLLSVGVTSTAGFGVWASLNAQATGSQAVESGTLSLTLGANGAGFSSAVTGLAPGDTVSRFVALTAGGTLTGKNLTMAVAGAGDAALLADGVGSVTTKALTIKVDSCSAAWTVTGTAGTCSGTTTPLLGVTPVSGLSGATSLVPGAVAPGSVQHLRVTVQLPDQTETVVNGVLPATTVQGKTANLGFTFGLTQRDATSTAS